MKTKYETAIDELLKEAQYNHENALEYCNMGFNDDELNRLTKNELVNLLGKAFIGIVLSQQKIVHLTKTLIETNNSLTSSVESLNLIESESFVKGLKYAPKLRAKVNSKKSHQETEKMKKEIQDHFRESKLTSSFKTKTEAYRYYSKIYPLSYETIKKYLANL